MNQLTITTKRGFEFTTPPERELIFWHGGHVRAAASCLTVGDSIRLPLGATVDVATAAALPVSGILNSRSATYNLPSQMSAELAEFFGLMVADGTIFRGGKGFRLAKRYQSVIDRFAYLIEALFGYQPIMTNVTGTPAVEVHSVHIARWLLSFGGLAPNAKDVPAAILQSPLGMQAAFLRGLFEDGAVNRRGDTIDYIHWENCNHAVVATVQSMLLRFGIVSSRRFHHGIGSLYLYSQHAARFTDAIGFVADEKNALLRGARYGEDRHCLVPITRDELVPLQHLLSVTDKQNARARGYLSRCVAEKLAAKSSSVLLNERLCWHYEPVTDIAANELAKMSTDELRLLYVAVTRAKRELDITAIDFNEPEPEGEEDAE